MLSTPTCKKIHTETRISACELFDLLNKAGQREDAQALAAKHGVSPDGWVQITMDGETLWMRANDEEPGGFEAAFTEPEGMAELLVM